MTIRLQRCDLKGAPHCAGSHRALLHRRHRAVLPRRSRRGAPLGAETRAAFRKARQHRIIIRDATRKIRLGRSKRITPGTIMLIFASTFSRRAGSRFAGQNPPHRRPYLVVVSPGSIAGPNRGSPAEAAEALALDAARSNRRPQAAGGKPRPRAVNDREPSFDERCLSCLRLRRGPRLSHG